MVQLGLRLTPHGRLLLEPSTSGGQVDDEVAKRLNAAFTEGSAEGLLQLGAREIGSPLPPDLAWWRSFGASYIEGVCLASAGFEADPNDTGACPAPPPPDSAVLGNLVLAGPMMTGSEYLTPDLLARMWRDLGEAFALAFARAGTDLQPFLTSLNGAWNLVGRVHFNLAENRRDAERPFAFIATYTSGLTAQARAQHAPLGQALRDYAGKGNRERLLSLLLPVQRAAGSCAWLRTMVDSGEVFHPLRWETAEASRMLASIAELESAGVIVRMPAGWRGNRPARPQVTAVVGARAPSQLGLDGLLDFQMDVSLDGEKLSEREIRDLLAGKEALVMLRGKWVEVDRDRIAAAMGRYEAAQALAERDGLTLAEAMRMLAGATLGTADEDLAIADWSRVTAGPWLAETLKRLRTGDAASSGEPAPGLRATLRPYQKDGVQWLHLLSGLGLGACLADDMGLGKTIQVLALLLRHKSTSKTATPSLLVAPASLLANWMAEIERFAPDMKVVVVHPSAMPADDIKSLTTKKLSQHDLAITSYGTVLRLPVVAKTSWNHVVLDEAQAIKNPSAKVTKAVKTLKARSRVALTGTPVENHPGDLWSIFDFINPGLLGNATQFRSYTKALAAKSGNPWAPLRELVRPYILRRMKSDKSVIADLPDKTEVKAWCGLSRHQAALYSQTVAELARVLEEVDGMGRRGVVLATMMRLKQICNHPSQWLGDNAWAANDSGKFDRLREIAEVVASRQEKMLVFTQFREITEPLEEFLASVFGRRGLVLHGQTPIARRKTLVQRFQDDESTPFFVLSMKAGGSGLNLTAASHVVHFDRWWNPAVENQATDRAFRIGQKRNVLVHKFVCRGTVEEKIDSLIDSKTTLSADLLDSSGTVNVTEMKDEELLRMVALDLNSAAQV